MRLLADENIPLAAVEALRAAGHDVLWVRSVAPGSPDSAILALAQRDERVLLTFDKDFGELAFRSGLPARCGIVLLRLVPAGPQEVARTLVTVLQARDDWSGHFSVVEQDRIRMIPLPA